jgi:hypothetical protein
MKFEDFLSELSGLQSISVRYAQNHDLPEDLARQVWIGYGRWNRQNDGATPGDPFLLTNKGTAQRFGLAHDYTCATKFAMNPPKGYLESWDLWARRPLTPSEALASMTLVADDASPDAVIALLVLLARLANVDPSALPAPWIEAVDYWERSGVADDAWGSWCALESALTHRYFPREGPTKSEPFDLAWLDALRFAAKCMALQASPTRIPELPDVAEYVQARAAMEQEQEIYWDWLQRATTLQVSLPLGGATSRRMLVDGLIVEAQQSTGSTKVFFRNDRENSSLGRGFSFSALCSPASPGEEMDITISVDPKRGVSLLRLWQAIERRESRAWADAGEVRSTESPRAMEGVSNVYLEPWYIDPTQTLIGRPRRLESGAPGSLLSWQDVCEVIWQELNPLRGVMVLRSDSGELSQLLHLTPEHERADHAKHFFAAKWINSLDEEALLLPRSLSSSTFFLRCLAAKLHHGKSTKPVGLRDLPSHSSWDLVELNGGVAVVNHDGLFVLDDWSEEVLSIDEIRSDFHRAAKLDAKLIDLETNELRPLVEDVQRLLEQERHAPSVDELLRRAANLSALLAEMRGDCALLPKSPDARLIRSAIEKSWSLDRRLAVCEDETRSLETSLHSLSELGTARIGRVIATYGFALVLAMESCQFVAKALFNALHYGMAETDAPSLFIFGCFAIVAIVLSIALNLLIALERPLKRRKVRSRKAI